LAPSPSAWLGAGFLLAALVVASAILMMIFNAPYENIEPDGIEAFLNGAGSAVLAIPPFVAVVSVAVLRHPGRVALLGLVLLLAEVFAVAPLLADGDPLG
jgi:hypothetical protein